MISADKLSMRLETALGGRDLIVETSHRLPYAIFATSYEGKPGQFGGGEPATKSHGYQTDLLVAERLDAKRWVPRVVVEFKLGKLTRRHIKRIPHFRAINEVRFLNNAIKHSGRVTPELAKKYPRRWKLGQDLANLGTAYERLKGHVPNYIFRFAEKVKLRFK